MRKSLKALGVVSALAAGIAAAPALYAHDSKNPQGSMMGPGMMGGGNMMGMTNMMGQMNQMVENCNKMMQAMMAGQDPEHAHDPLRNDEPAQPEN